MPVPRPDSRFPLTSTVLEVAVADRAFPAAVIEVGRSSGALWSRAFGTLTYDRYAPAASVETVFDLASLTKVIATASIAMRLVAKGRLALDQSVRAALPRWSSPGRESITVRHLLDHSSGLPAHARLWERVSGRAGYEAALLQLPLAYPTGQQSVYSDVGFMLLGFIIEDAAGAPLAAEMDALASALGLGALCYRPPPAWRNRTAPTEFDPWRDRLLCGEVHDENAAALGGIAAHAGLFGTAQAVGRFAAAATAALRDDTSGPAAALPLMRQFARRTGVRGSSRALGWDTMLVTSSCGTRLSPEAIGHTGFTGTSLWIDPIRDLYVVLLTNRVHPTRTNQALVAVRPRVHDAVVLDLEAGS